MRLIPRRGRRARLACRVFERELAGCEGLIQFFCFSKILVFTSALRVLAVSCFRLPGSPLSPALCFGHDTALVPSTRT